MKKIYRQSGAASIMFTMFMIIVVSLIAIGFATLVRNDQRAALDKTLSNQAQYAAESAINKVQGLLQDGTITTSSAQNCQGSIGATSYTPTISSGTTISCLDWDMDVDALVFNSVDTSPRSSIIKPATPSAIQSLQVTWATSGMTTHYNPPLTPLVLSSGHIPTLKLVLAKNDLSAVREVYLVPSNSAPNTDITGAGNGALISAQCTAAGSCVANFRNLPGGPWNNGGGWGMVSLSALNGTADTVTVKAFTDPNENNSTKMTGGQATITATARSQDVIKHLVATVSLEKTTWRPGFAAASDTLCKNYKADGLNNNNAGPLYGTVCP